MVNKETEAGGRWALRDSLAAVALFAATAGVILWQNAHIVVLWDLSYVLDTAARIAAGQMPYRDFPLVHSPLTFVVQAAIMRLTGRVLFHHTLYVAAIGGLSTILAWRLALRLSRLWWVALMLAAPLVVVGIYCILPNPSYDCECAFWMLVALWFVLRLEDAGAVWGCGIAAGAAACVPVFFKQNMGLPFLVAVLVAAVCVLVLRCSAERRALWGVLAGAVMTLAAAVAALHFTAGIGNYVQWTVRFAGQKRMPTAGAMLSVYAEPQLLWMLPCLAVGWLLLRLRFVLSHPKGEAPQERSFALRMGHPQFVVGKSLPDSSEAGMGSPSPAEKGSCFPRSQNRDPGHPTVVVIALFLMAAPFLWTLSSLVRFEGKDDRAAAFLAVWPLVLIAAWGLAVWRVVRLRGAVGLCDLLPFVLLVGITGTFMSQQLWGSTYAIWPLLVLLIAELMSALPDVKWVRSAMAAVIGVTLLVCGTAYLVSEERLEYAQFPAGPAVHSTMRELKGLATPGPFVPELEEMLRYAAANIPAGDGVVLIPGEDPFYFVTGRVPQFPVLLFDPTTDPYSPEETTELARARDIRWLIVKRDLQMVGNPAPEPVALMQALEREFTLVARLKGYDVYGRNRKSRD
jgi:hypothetical protein